MFFIVFMTHFLSSMSFLFIPKQGEKTSRVLLNHHLCCSFNCPEGVHHNHFLVRFFSCVTTPILCPETCLVECVRLGCSPSQDAIVTIRTFHFFQEGIPINFKPSFCHYFCVWGGVIIPKCYNTLYYKDF